MQYLTCDFSSCLLQTYLIGQNVHQLEVLGTAVHGQTVQQHVLVVVLAVCVDCVQGVLELASVEDDVGGLDCWVSCWFSSVV